MALAVCLASGSGTRLPAATTAAAVAAVRVIQDPWGLAPDFPKKRFYFICVVSRDDEKEETRARKRKNEVTQQEKGKKGKNKTRQSHGFMFC